MTGAGTGGVVALQQGGGGLPRRRLYARGRPPPPPLGRGPPPAAPPSPLVLVARAVSPPIPPPGSAHWQTRRAGAHSRGYAPARSAASGLLAALLSVSILAWSLRALRLLLGQGLGSRLLSFFPRWPRRPVFLPGHGVWGCAFSGVLSSARRERERDQEFSPSPPLLAASSRTSRDPPPPPNPLLGQESQPLYPRHDRGARGKRKVSPPLWRGFSAELLMHWEGALCTIRW